MGDLRGAEKGKRWMREGERKAGERRRDCEVAKGK
jgi:hypothetical protein